MHILKTERRCGQEVFPTFNGTGYGGSMGNKTAMNQRTVPLLEECIYFGGMTLVYQLLLYTDGALRKYLICVRRDQEACVRDVGESLPQAMKCYRDAIRGAVTPFSLESAVKYFSS